MYPVALVDRWVLICHIAGCLFSHLSCGVGGMGGPLCDVWQGGWLGFHVSYNSGGWVGPYVSYRRVDGLVLMYNVTDGDGWVRICLVAGFMGEL